MPDEMTFDETMTGFYSPASDEPSRGFRVGRQENRFIRGDFRISIRDMDAFIGQPDHQADLTGTVTAAGLGEDLEVLNGQFNLFRKNLSGVRQMQYRFAFEVNSDPYFFDGHKEISDDPSALDATEDMTTLFTRIYHGDPDSGSREGDPDSRSRVAGAGILRFHLRDLPLLVASIDTPNCGGIKRLRIIHKFFGFAFGEMARTYLFSLR